MNKTISTLLAKRNALESAHTDQLINLNAKIRAEYCRVFDKDKNLQKAIFDAQSSNDYGSDENGIYQWFRYIGLSDIEEHAKEFLADYVQDHGLDIDWENDAFMIYQGESLIIQDDTRHDNGIWLNDKRIINETEYKDDNGVDTAKRNKIIEAWMEKEGFFPGVFRVTQHGDVFHVNTQEKD